MHRFAGTLGQSFQMCFSYPHNVHTIDDAAGQLKHFQRQPVPAGRFVLGHIAKPHQAGQQPVHRALGQVGALGQPLQAGPCGVRCQQLNQRKNALHTLYAAFFRHKTASFPKFNNLFIFSCFRRFFAHHSTLWNDYNKERSNLQPPCRMVEFESFAPKNKRISLYILPD